MYWTCCTLIIIIYICLQALGCIDLIKQHYAVLTKLGGIAMQLIESAI